jgi:exodeoxyribonuclease VII large subunit
MKIYKVSELLEEIKWVLEDNFGFVSVEGEASEVKYSQRGHLYFSLKDDKALIKIVMWANMVLKLPFKIEEGRVFIVTGILTIYPPLGSFQMEAKKIEPSGIGALKLALEQRKKKLQEEGLFDESKKNPLPVLPQRIGIITSPEGAAIKDFLKILNECKVNIFVKVFPSLMQGKDAANEIIEGLKFFKKENVDLVVITRGGGSFEDLMPFNEEFLVREIYKFPIPVLSAVGHEVDVTLCDLVADIRAATPTDAARIIKNQLDDIYERILNYEEEIISFLESKIEIANLKLNNFKSIVSYKNLNKVIKGFSEKLNFISFKFKEGKLRFLKNKKDILKELNYNFSKKIYTFTLYHKGNLSSLEVKLKNIKYFLRQKKEKIEELKNGLLHLNLKRTLKRGFSILRKDEKIIRDSGEVDLGDNIDGELYKGRILCKIIKKEIN